LGAVEDAEPRAGEEPGVPGTVAKLSVKIKAAPAGGGVYAPGDGGALREKFTYRGREYRIDLENIKGHNLRE
jgi:hypothetical protein